MFYFFLSWNILIKVQGMIALNHGINDLLVLAVDKSQHFPDANFCMLKAISVQELKYSNYFDCVLNRLRREHHDQQSASIVHLGQELSKLEVSVLDSLSIFDQVLLLPQRLLCLIVLMIIRQNQLQLC